MRPTESRSRIVRSTLRVLIGLVGLSAVACESSMNFTAPTAPTRFSPNPGGRTLQISGTLEVRDGECFEATLLYDGVEIPGARVSCPGSACGRVQLQGSIVSEIGRHSISFKVIRQSAEILDYVVQGSALVTRAGVNLNGAALPLGPAQAQLAAGGAVSFDVSFTN